MDLLHECPVCLMDSKARSKVVPEDGTVEASLHNAHLLIRKMGIPRMIVLYKHPTEGYVVEAVFEDYSSFFFYGFSWGSSSRKAQGLALFLSMIGLPVNPDDVVSWTDESRQWLRAGEKWVSIPPSPAL